LSQRIVYMIDDEPEFLAVLTDVVEVTGHTVHAFNNGHDFFDQVDAFEKNSLLILDLQMPEMDGVEVIRRLSVMSSPPKLILMSGHDSGILHSVEKLARARSLDVISYVEKPIDIELFKQLLTENKPNSCEPSDLLTTIFDNNEDHFEELQSAINDDQLVLHYQPQIEINSGKLIGVEALVRWQHPEAGLLYPDKFVPAAEKNGLISSLTQWVIDTAVKQKQQWQQQGINIHVSVNISAHDITSLTFPEQFAELLADNLLDPTMLILEVTESALMEELITSLDILTRLRLKGVGLSIDDFGTGYSSLSQLHRIPFTELKIDRSFVSKMTVDEEAKAIVKTCILLGHELKLQVVAEGVETEEQLILLNTLGCDIAQGYFIGRPGEAKGISDFK